MITRSETLGLASLQLNRIRSPLVVFIILGMLAADGLAVFFGHRFTDRVPMALVHKIASGLFILFGIGIILGF